MVSAERLFEAAMADAAGWPGSIAGAYARTKQVAREAVIEHILGTLEDDLAGVGRPEPA